MPASLNAPVPAGSQQLVVITGGPGNAADWVGLYQPNGLARNFLAWQYLNGLQTKPTKGLTAANLVFTLPPTPGQYELRFYRNDGYVLLVKGPLITTVLVLPGGATLQLVAGGPIQLVQGGQIMLVR